MWLLKVYIIFLMYLRFIKLKNNMNVMCIDSSTAYNFYNNMNILNQIIYLYVNDIKFLFSFINMDSVRVAIRVRPLVKSELERGCSNCVIADSINQQIIVNNNTNLTFTFNYVFSPEHSQSQVYKLAVEDLVKKLFSGNDIFVITFLIICMVIFYLII